MGVDPFSMAAIGLTVAGGVMQAGGQMAAGDAASQAASYRAQVRENNALIAEQNAKWEAQAGDAAGTAKGLETRALVGSMKAAQASNNVDVERGSAAEVRTAAHALGELDQMTIRSNSAKRVLAHQTEAVNQRAGAALDRYEGEDAKRAGKLAALTTLVTSAASVGGKFKGMQSPGSTGISGPLNILPSAYGG